MTNIGDVSATVCSTKNLPDAPSEGVKLEDWFGSVRYSSVQSGGRSEGWLLDMRALPMLGGSVFTNWAAGKSQGYLADGGREKAEAGWSGVGPIPEASEHGVSISNWILNDFWGGLGMGRCWNLALTLSVSVFCPFSTKHQLYCSPLLPLAASLQIRAGSSSSRASALLKNRNYKVKNWKFRFDVEKFINQIKACDIYKCTHM